MLKLIKRTFSTRPGNSKVTEGVLFGLGNPLLDISAPVTAAFLEKYFFELKHKTSIIDFVECQCLIDKAILDLHSSHDGFIFGSVEFELLKRPNMWMSHVNVLIFKV